MSELNEGREDNAVRLLRHLWEFELELTYVLREPDQRLPQVVAGEARNYVRIGKQDPSSRFDQRLRADYAKSQEDKAMAYLPSREVMATAIGRNTEYTDWYRPLSARSHPGVRAGERFADVTEADLEAAWSGEIDLSAIRVRRPDAGRPAQRDQIVAGVAVELWRSLVATGPHLSQEAVETLRGPLFSLQRELSEAVAELGWASGG